MTITTCSQDHEPELVRLRAENAQLRSENADLKRQIADGTHKPPPAPEDEWDRTFHATSDMISIIGTDLTIRRANRAMATRLHTTPDALINQRCIFCRDHCEPHDPNCPVAHTLADGKSRQMEQFVAKLEGYFQVSTSPIRDENGGIIAVVHVARDITAIKEQEKRLHEGRNHFRDIVENAPIGIFQSSPDGTFYDVNPALVDMLGYDSKEDLIETINRSSIQETIYVDHDKRSGLVKQVLQKNGWNTVENRYYRKDGSIITANLFFRKVLDEAGDVTYLEGFVQDITRRKIAEDALLSSEREYRSLFDQAHDAILIFEPEQEVILDVNSRACEVYGFERDEFIGMSVQGITRDEKAGRQKIAAIMEQGTYSGFETVHRCKNGKLITLEINASVIEYQGQTAILSLNRDVTERRRMEEAVRQSEFKFRTFFEETQLGNLLISGLDDPVIINRTFAKMLGYTIEELHAMKMHEMLERISYPSDLELEKTYIEKLRRREISGYELEKRYIRKDGSILWGELRVIQLHDENGNFLIGLTSVLDITERKIAEQKVKASEFQLKQIINLVPHVIVVKDSDGKFLLANQAASTFANRPADKMVGHYEREWVKDKTVLTAIQKVDRDVIQSGEPMINAQEEFPDARGDRHILLTSKVPFRPEGYDKPALICVSIDITHQKEIEWALRESESRYRQLFETNKAIKLIIDPDTGQIVQANQAACDYYGYTMEELTALRISDINTLSRAQVQREMNMARAEKRLYFNFKHRLKNGSVRDVEVYSGPLLLDQHTYIYSIIHDITDRRKAEAALQKSEKRLNQAQQIAHVGNFEHFWDNGTAYWSDEMFRLLGYSPGSVQPTHQRLLDHVHHDEQEHFIKVLEGAIIKQDTFELELRFMRKDNLTRIGLLRGYVDLSADSSQICINGALMDITRQKRSEEALRESEAKFRTLVEQLPVVTYIATLEPTRQILYMSPQIKQSLGFSQEDFNTNPELLSTHIHPADREWVTTKLSHALTHDTRFFAEYRLYNRHGNLVWVRDEAVLVKGHHHEALFLQGVLSDINPQKQAEQALRRSEERYRTLMANFPNGAVFLFDQDLRFILADGQDLSRIGLSRNFVLGKTMWEVFTSDLSQRLEPLFRGAFEGERAVTEINYANNIYDIYVVPINNDEGEVVAGMAMSQIITQRKKAEEGLRTVNARLKAILESPKNIMIFSVDHDYCYTIFDNHFKQMMKKVWDIDVHIGKSLLTLIPEKKARKRIKHNIDRALNGEQFVLVESYENESIAATPYEVIYSPTIAEDGSIIGVTVLLQDITERVAYEKNLREARDAAESASKTKSEFLANMSHELRTPLNAILGYAQILSRNPNLMNTHARAVQSIYSSGQHLLTLLNDILDLSKVDAGKLVLNHNQFNLKQFLRDIVDSNRLRAVEQGLEFNFELDEGLPDVVVGDEVRIRQIVLNLLGNAIKFTELGSVTFKVGHAWNTHRFADATEPDRHHENAVRFVVADTGAGIPPEQLKEIFQPFHQIDSLKNRTRGTGLGLAICERLARMMHSHIQVQSQPGQGTRFWFDINLQPIEWKAAEPPPKSDTIIGHHLSDGTTGNILVIDPEPENRTVLQELLDTFGFTVIPAANLVEVMPRLNKLKPHLAFVDIRLPIEENLDIIRKVKNLCVETGCKVIAVSTNEGASTQMACLQGGCDAFLAKPIALDSLIQIIQNYLDIEWIYETPAPEQEPQELLNGLSAPPAAAVEKFYKMAQMGDIFGIRDAIQALSEQERDAHPTFYQKISELAANYEIEKIQDIIQTLWKELNNAKQK